MVAPFIGIKIIHVGISILSKQRGKMVNHEDNLQKKKELDEYRDLYYIIFLL